MKLLFKQRAFSWFDSYDIFDEAGNTVFIVKGEPAWGHCFRIYDLIGNEVGCVKQKLFSWYPKFEIYQGNNYVGSIYKQFSLFRPSFAMDCMGWQIDGNLFERNYNIRDAYGQSIAFVYKEMWNWTDTYVIDVYDSLNAVCILMIVLAIDAEKDSRN